MVQWLRLRLPAQEAWVRSPLRDLRSHLPCSQEIKTPTRDCIRTNSIQAFKNVIHIFFLILKKKNKTKEVRLGFQHRGLWGGGGGPQIRDPPLGAGH